MFSRFSELIISSAKKSVKFVEIVKLNFIKGGKISVGKDSYKVLVFKENIVIKK